MARLLLDNNPLLLDTNPLFLESAEDVPSSVIPLWESGSVTYQYSQPRPGDDANSTVVRRTGNLVVGDPLPTYMDPGRALFKPYVEMQAPSTGNWVKFYLGEFVSLAPTTDRTQDRIIHRYRLVDRIQEYARARTFDWYVADIDTNIALLVRDILGDEFGETKFDIPGTSDVLDFDLVFPSGTSWLEVINTCLQSVGWDELSIDSEGRNTTRPSANLKGVEWHYPEDTPIVTSAKVEPFVGEIPNVLIFKAKRGPTLPEEGNGIFTVTNQVIGPLSVDGRDGTIVSEEVLVEASDQNKLQRLALAIAEIRFKGGGDVVRLGVGLNPLHDDKDLVNLRKTDLGIDDQRFWVSSWSIKMSSSVRDMATMSLTLEAAIFIDDIFFNDFSVSTESLVFDVERVATTTDTSTAAATLESEFVDSSVSTSNVSLLVI